MPAFTCTLCLSTTREKSRDSGGGGGRGKLARGWKEGRGFIGDLGREGRRAMIHQVVSAAECFNWGFPLHDHGGGGERTASALGPLSRVGIQWRADDNYARKFCAAVVDLLLNFGHFW